MSVIRERAKSNFPMVLLTLLSIVQALAFELLWGEIHEHPAFYQWTWEAAMAWVRVATMLLGIIIVWSSYATAVMRFLWVPTTSDTFFPFFIGIVQFIMIERLGTEDVASWLLCLAILFATMNGINHYDMRRARLDIENAEFFDQRGKASVKDFIPPVIIVTTLCAFSFGIWLTEPDGWLASVAALLTLSLMCYQVVTLHMFWETTMSLESKKD